MSSRQDNDNGTDNHAFMAEFQDVRPLQTSDTYYLAKPKETTLAQQLKRKALEKESASGEFGLSLHVDEALDAHAPLEYQKPGVQHGVYKNLRLGKYVIDTQIYIRGLPPEKAMYQIVEDLKQCHQRGVRCLLVQHGQRNPADPNSVRLKSHLNNWLRQLPWVLAFHSALKQHGGLAATYVLLKKNNEDKLENRERHLNKKG